MGENRFRIAICLKRPWNRTVLYSILESGSPIQRHQSRRFCARIQIHTFSWHYCSYAVGTVPFLHTSDDLFDKLDQIIEIGLRQLLRDISLGTSQLDSAAKAYHADYEDIVWLVLQDFLELHHCRWISLTQCFHHSILLTFKLSSSILTYSRKCVFGQSPKWGFGMIPNSSCASGLTLLRWEQRAPPFGGLQFRIARLNTVILPMGREVPEFLQSLFDFVPVMSTRALLPQKKLPSTQVSQFSSEKKKSQVPRGPKD